MKKTLLAILAILILSSDAEAQEAITLSVAETKPSNSVYLLDDFHFKKDDPATTPLDEGYMVLVLKGQNGEIVTCTYNAGTPTTGTFLINALNKANLSSVYAGNATTGTLTQRIYHRLIVLGESTAVCGKTLTGSITGAVP